MVRSKKSFILNEKRNRRTVFTHFGQKGIIERRSDPPDDEREGAQERWGKETITGRQVS